MQPALPAPEVSAADVAAFLRANPAWLAAQPDLYAVLHPPARVHGDRLADHMAAMLVRARAGTAAWAAATAERRAADSFGHRVQEAVLALMATRDLHWCLQHELPAVLHLDGVRLCCEDPAGPGAWILPGTVDAALGRCRAVVRAGVHTPSLHGEATGLAVHEALVRVPLAGSPALLALACRDGSALAGAAPPTLAFLGNAVAGALARE